MIYTLINRSRASTLPRASEVLNAYLCQENYPHWTSYFVKYKDCVNDQFGSSYFVHSCPQLAGQEAQPQWRYLVLRTGCFPFMKYHCTRIHPTCEINHAQVRFQNHFFNLIKLINLGKKKRTINIFYVLFAIILFN